MPLTTTPRRQAFFQVFLLYEIPQYVCRLLTGNVEEGVGGRRRSEPVGRLTAVPAGVRALNAADDEAAVAVDAGARHQPGDEVHVDAVAEPLVRDVVGVGLGLADQSHAPALHRRRVLRRHHDVRVRCTHARSRRPLRTYTRGHRAK